MWVCADCGSIVRGPVRGGPANSGGPSVGCLAQCPFAEFSYRMLGREV